MYNACSQFWDLSARPAGELVRSGGNMKRRLLSKSGWRSVLSGHATLIAFVLFVLLVAAILSRSGSAILSCRHSGALP